MNRTKVFCALAAAGLLCGTGPVSADADQPWHFTGQFGKAKTDHERYIDDDDIFWSIGFGRFFGNNFSIDLEYDEYGGTFKEFVAVPNANGSSNREWTMKNVGLMARYHFGQSKVRPYVGAGLGSQSHDNVFDGSSELSMSAVVGLQGSLTKHISGRFQVMYRLDRDGATFQNSKNYGDLIYGIGFNLDFGGKEPPPPPPPPEKKAPPPPPPNPDLDGDGVLNPHDKCPNTRPGAVVDLDGCEVEAVIELEGVHFDFDKATLKPEAKSILDEAAALLKKHERVVVEVAGHTDSTGAESYNQGLSERRANAVKDYLSGKGVQAQRLSSKGYGESMPVASNDTKAGRAENRRVELIVLDR